MRVYGSVDLVVFLCVCVCRVLVLGFFEEVSLLFNPRIFLRFPVLYYLPPAPLSLSLFSSLLALLYSILF
jgi:hypothetical protein